MGVWGNIASARCLPTSETREGHKYLVRHPGRCGKNSADVSFVTSGALIYSHSCSWHLQTVARHALRPPLPPPQNSPRCAYVVHPVEGGALARGAQRPRLRALTRRLQERASTPHCEKSQWLQWRTGSCSRGPFPPHTVPAMSCRASAHARATRQRVSHRAPADTSSGAHVTPLPEPG